MAILITVLASFLVTLLLGRVLIPALHALKAGQSIREIGPKWHQVKEGTPTMGGMMFIVSAVLCVLLIGWPSVAQGRYEHLMVLGFSLVYGAIGFVDDFVKVKLKRNLGLTALQKLILQLAAALGYLALHRGVPVPGQLPNPGRCILPAGRGVPVAAPVAGPGPAH